MSLRGELTRQRLLEAAALLFAERGVSGVSLREINEAAGQRNTNALHYHFGDRDGLVRALAERQTAAMGERQRGLYDACVAAGTTGDLRTLLGVLQRPAAEYVQRGPVRAAWVQVAAQLLTSPRTSTEDILAGVPDVVMARAHARQQARGAVPIRARAIELQRLERLDGAAPRRSRARTRQRRTLAMSSAAAGQRLDPSSWECGRSASSRTPARLTAMLRRAEVRSVFAASGCVSVGDGRTSRRRRVATRASCALWVPCFAAIGICRQQGGWPSASLSGREAFGVMLDLCAALWPDDVGAGG